MERSFASVRQSSPCSILLPFLHTLPSSLFSVSLFDCTRISSWPWHLCELPFATDGRLLAVPFTWHWKRKASWPTVASSTQSGLGDCPLTVVLTGLPLSLPFCSLFACICINRCQWTQFGSPLVVHWTLGSLFPFVHHWPLCYALVEFVCSSIFQSKWQTVLKKQKFLNYFRLSASNDCSLLLSVTAHMALGRQLELPMPPSKTEQNANDQFTNKLAVSLAVL